MTTAELIKYIFETPLEDTVFEDNQQKGERALLLLEKYGDNAQSSLAQRFGDKVTFQNITPKKASEIIKQLNTYLGNTKQEFTVLAEKKNVRIYANNTESNIPGFEYSYDYIGAGSKKSPTYLNVVDAFFFDGEKQISRNHEKYEGRISALLLARLAFQVFDGNLGNLSEEQRRALKTDGTDYTIGVWTDKNEQLLRWGNGANAGKLPKVDYVADMYLANGYPSNSNGKYFFYNCGLYDSMCLAQSFLKAFGKEGQYFEVVVSQKDDAVQNEHGESDSISIAMETSNTATNYQNKYSAVVIESRNIIFRGAPGTGKSFLAKEIASDIVSNGTVKKHSLLSDEQKRKIEFVQFHPSYDYTDFVEGLRPKVSADGSMGFELQDGIFKKFVAKAQKAQNVGVDNFDESWDKLVSVLEANNFVQIPYVQGKKSFPIELNELGTGLATRTYKGGYGDGEWISGKSRFYNKEQLYNIYRGRPGVPLGGHDNYRKAIVQYMKDNLGLRPFVYSESGSSSPFVFIIDEINRGEISKIFGELFFALDPSYRGKAGEVSTQYANLHVNPEEKFFIPDNVYIIGTMNDIDRSVDSFDFAMRRRFRFIEIKANERLEMLDGLKEKDEAIRRMNSLNQAIASVEEELNENYHIGASYFLKLETLSFEQLWTDYLAPLLQDYVRGMYDEKGILEKFKVAYEKAGTSNDDDNDG